MSVVRRRDGPPRPPIRQRPDSWDAYLDSDEELLWQGEPAAGLRFKFGDIFQSLFGAVFLGFAIFWIDKVISMTSRRRFGGAFGGGGTDDTIIQFMPLFGVPFVLAGAYMLFGRFLWNAYVRSRTRYALTDKRAFIAKNALRRKLQSWPIDRHTQIEFQPGREATLWFAQEERRNSKGRSYRVKRGFEYIADGDRVYRLIRNIQQADRKDR